MFKRYGLNQDRRARQWRDNGGSEFKICDQPQSPNEGSCLRYVLNLARQMRGRFSSSRNVMNRQVGGEFKTLERLMEP